MEKILPPGLKTSFEFGTRLEAVWKKAVTIADAGEAKPVGEDLAAEIGAFKGFCRQWCVARPKLAGNFGGDAKVVLNSSGFALFERDFVNCDLSAGASCS